MKARTYSDSSFFAKMVLLFALVFLGHPTQRKGIELYLNSFLSGDSATMGNIPAVKIATSANIQSSLSH
jgi:hypothetical protein